MQPPFCLSPPKVSPTMWTGGTWSRQRQRRRLRRKKGWQAGRKSCYGRSLHGRQADKPSSCCLHVTLLLQARYGLSSIQDFARTHL